jgi:hypothetical protein
LLISQATDSAGNFSLYSGYIFLPEVNKWKLIGTLKTQGRWNAFRNLQSITEAKRQPIAITIPKFSSRQKFLEEYATNKLFCQL